MKTISLLALMTISAVVYSDFAKAETRQISKGTVIGCKNNSDRDKLDALKSSNDRDAYMKFSKDVVLSGKCHIFDDNDIAYMVDYKFLNLRGCFRPKGDIDCFWASLNSFQAAR